MMNIKGSQGELTQEGRFRKNASEEKKHPLNIENKTQTEGWKIYNPVWALKDGDEVTRCDDRPFSFTVRISLILQ